MSLLPLLTVRCNILYWRYDVNLKLSLEDLLARVKVGITTTDSTSVSDNESFVLICQKEEF